MPYGIEIVDSTVHLNVDAKGTITGTQLINTHITRTIDKTKKAVDQFGYMYLAIKRIATYTAIFSFFAGFVRILGQVVELQKRQAEVMTLVDMRNERAAQSYHNVMKSIMALPPHLGSAIELTKGLYEIMSAGITKPREAFDVLVASAKYAKAGLTDLATAASSVTAIMKAYSLESTKAREVTDMLFASVMEGKFHADELNDAIGKVIPTAAAMGVGIDEVVTALAVLTQRGLDVHEAATGLNRMLLAWMKPLDKSQKAFYKLGLEWGRNAFSAMSFGETLNVIAEASKRYGDLLPQIFTRQRGLRAGFIMTGSGLKDYFALLQRVRGATEGAGEVSRAAAKIQATLADQIKAARNEILQQASSWDKWTDHAKLAVRSIKDFVIAIIHAPQYLASMIMAHRMYTVALNEQNAKLLMTGRYLERMAGASDKVRAREAASIAVAEKRIVQQGEQVKRLKLMRFGLMALLTALLLVNEAVVRWGKASERAMAMMMANARRMKELRDEAKRLDAVLRDMGEKWEQATVKVAEKIAAGYVIQKLQELKESGRDVGQAFLYMRGEMLKLSKQTQFDISNLDMFGQEVHAVMTELWETGKIGDEHYQVLRLLASGYGLTRKAMEEAVSTQKRRIPIAERLYEAERQVALVMRDMPDVVGDAAKHWQILVEQFDLDKLKSMERTIQTVLNPQFEGAETFLAELKQRGYGVEQYRDTLEKALTQIQKAIKESERAAFSEGVQEWVRTLSQGFVKFKMEGAELQKFVLGMKQTWKMFVQSGIGDTKLFVQSIGENGKRLIANWNDMSKAQQSGLETLYNILVKSSQKESKARQKALDDMADWGTEYQQILNDVAQMENQLLDRKHENILVKAQEENMLKKKQLDEEYQNLLTHHGFSISSWLMYYSMLDAMARKEHMAKQLMAKEWMDAENKRRHEILRKDYEFVWQRLAGAKRYYREMEAAIINMEGIDSKTRKKMLLENKKFWEDLIEEYHRADTALGRWVAGLKLAARMLGSLVQILQSFVQEMGWQESAMGRIVDAFAYLAQGIRAAGAALEAYKKAQEVAGSDSSQFIDKLTKVASVVDLVIVAVTTAIGFIKKLFGGKSEQQKAAEEAERQQRAMEAAVKDITAALSKYGEVSEAVAKQIYELTQKGIPGFVAESMLMDKILQDIGITMENFAMFGERIIDVLEHMEQGYITTQEAITVFGASFQQMVDYVKKWGMEGSRVILDMIEKTRQLGIIVPEVAAYVKSQLEAAAQGLSAMIQWIAADAVKAWEATKELEKEKRKLMNQLARYQEQLGKLREGSQQWKDLKEKIEETYDAILKIDKELRKHQDIINETSNANIKSLKDLGIIASAVFNSMVAEGIPMTQILETMKDSIFALMDRYKALGLEVPEYLKPIFKVFRAFRGHEDVFKGLDGLVQVMQALGNSAYLTEDAFKALMREARRYYSMLTRERDKGGMGLPDKEAIRMLYPMLQQAWWYAEQYNMRLPKWMDDMIAKAKKMGFKFEAPVANQQLDELKKVNRAIDRNRRGIREAIFEVRRAVRDLGRGNYQHGTIGVPNTQFARIHEGEAILPSNVSQALREFFTGSRRGIFGGEGGGGMARVTVNIDGRAVYKSLVPYLREGGAYGDYEVTGEGVF